MSIGIYDSDFFNNKFTIPNLECMKLCRYYNRHNEFVTLTNTMNFKDNYSKFIIRQDYLSNDYNYTFLKGNNLYIGGRAINNNAYIPLDLNIEKSKADISQYLRYEKYFFNENHITIDDRYWKNIINGSHFRLSLDNKTVWKDFKSQLDINNKSKIFLHDYNLANIDNVFDVLTELNIKKYGCNGHLMYNKFPIYCNTIESLLQWLNYYTPKEENLILGYNGLFSGENIKQLVEFYYPRSSHFSYIRLRNKIPMIFSKSEFYNDIFPKLYLQVSLFYKYKIKILLTIDEFSNKIDWIYYWLIILNNRIPYHPLSSVFNGLWANPGVEDHIVKQLLVEAKYYNPKFQLIMEELIK